MIIGEADYTALSCPRTAKRNALPFFCERPPTDRGAVLFAQRWYHPVRSHIGQESRDGPRTNFIVHYSTMRSLKSGPSFVPLNGTKTRIHMNTPRNDGYTSTASNPDAKDNMGLTANQRMMAWVALGAGLLALIWGLMRDPDTTNKYDTASETEQRDPAASKANTP